MPKIILVSHSKEIASGTKSLLKQMAGDVDIIPIRIHRNLVTTVFIGFGVPNGSLNYILSKILVVFLSSSLNFSSNK